MGKGGVEVIDGSVEGEGAGADELDDVAAEAFFEAVDTIIFGVWIGEVTDAVEIVAGEAVLGGVLYHMPLDEVLGVVFFHVGFVAARIEVDDLVAGEHKHGDREGDGFSG